MSGYNTELIDRTGRAQRKRYKRSPNKKPPILAWVVMLLVVGVVIALAVLAFNGIAGLFAGQDDQNGDNQQVLPLETRIQQTIEKADFIAYGYDYEKAVETIKDFGEDYENHEALTAAITKYQNDKLNLVRWEDVTKVTHVFFHTLVVDNKKCFDGEYTEGGYNQFMTTISEFNKMMEEMYKKNFVLVNITDVAYEKTMPDGTKKFVPGDIMLPPGKKPVIISQDDVNYYKYMTTDGFATRIVIGDDGYPTCEYIGDDGVVQQGDFDMVPLLEKFIQKHPDFSYKGARAILALTGYEGVLGYRTRPDSPTYQQDLPEAKKVADRMKELGWVFASHSWGHVRFGAGSVTGLTEDTDKWEREVVPVVGNTDIFIYPHGEDIAGVGDYKGPKYEMLKAHGFKYFCNVDSSQYWVQIHDGYVRQGRRNLDGYRMYHNPEMLRDLFEVNDVWDSDRPIPVPPM